MKAEDIQKRIDMLEKSKEEYKIKKEMLDDALKNDTELTEMGEKVKDVKNQYNLQKEAVLNEPEYRKIVEDLKDVAIEIKDTKKLLGDELVAYFMANNTMEYIAPDGKKMRFSVTAKFVGKKEDE